MTRRRGRRRRKNPTLGGGRPKKTLRSAGPLPCARIDRFTLSALTALATRRDGDQGTKLGIDRILGPRIIAGLQGAKAVVVGEAPQDARSARFRAPRRIRSGIRSGSTGADRWKAKSPRWAVLAVRSSESSRRAPAKWKEFHGVGCRTEGGGAPVIHEPWMDLKATQLHVTPGSKQRNWL